MCVLKRALRDTYIYIYSKPKKRFNYIEKGKEIKPSIVGKNSILTQKRKSSIS